MSERGRVIQSFEPEPGSIFEIEIAEGDEVELTHADAPDGWLSVRIDDIEGLVPAAFVEIIGEDGAPASPKGEAEGASGGEEAGAPAANTDSDYDLSALEDANKRQALHDFEVEPGVIFELPLTKGAEALACSSGPLAAAALAYC